MKMATAKLDKDDERIPRRAATTQRRKNVPTPSEARRLRRDMDDNRRRKRRAARDRDSLPPDTIFDDDSGEIAAVPDEETVVITSRDTKGENVALEIKALMSICIGANASAALLGKLTDKHFHTQEVKIAFKRVKFLHQRTGTIPDFQTLLNEPSISLASRERIGATIKAHNIRPCRTDKHYLALFNTMDSYAKKRSLYEALNRIGDMVRQDGMDVDTALNAFQREAANLHSGFESSTIHISGGASDAGPEGTDLEMLARRILGKVEVLNPTRINAYDRVNGGTRPKSLIMFGADTSNFKSVMMLQHAINQAAEGKRVVFYSLEMDEDQFYQRFFANLADVDSLKEIIENTRAANLERNVKRIVEKVKEIWANWTLVAPAQSVSWEWIVANAESVDAEMVYVDYIGLLAGARGSDNTAQWQALDALTRDAKVYCNTSGRTVVLAAQMKFVNGQPELKYATAMKDHCDVAWGWSVFTFNGRTYLGVHVSKARGGKRFKYVVEVLPHLSRIVDVNLRDREQEEMFLNAVADMEAGKDPQERYREAMAANNGNRRNLQDPDTQRRQGGPAVANGGFAVKSYDVSAEAAPWDTDNTKQETVRDGVEGSVTALALAQAAIAEKRANAASSSRRAALAMLTENKTAGLSREQMRAQAREVLKMYDAVAAETHYGFDGIAEDMLKMQSALTGLRQQVNPEKYPHLANVLENERDKGFKHRATPSERAAHRKRIAFVQAAIKRLADAKKAREKVTLGDLVVAKRIGEANDGSLLTQVADPSAASNDWETNAVIFEDRQGVNLPNFAKPASKRWSLEKGRLEEGDARARRYPTDHQGKLIQMRWPPLSKLSYLSDAQLEHLVTLTNRWRGTPLVETVNDRRYQEDLAAWTALVGPARNTERKMKATPLTHAQLEYMKIKYGIGSSERKAPKNEQETRERARRFAANRTRRHKERVEALRITPKVREQRQIRA